MSAVVPSVVGRLRDWLRLRPLVADALLAAAALAASFLPLVVTGDEFVISPAMSALLVGGCLIVVVRRRYPWAVWGTTACLGMVAIGLSTDFTPLYLPALIGLYTVGAHKPAQHALAAGAISLAGPLAVILLAPADLVRAVAYGYIAWSIVALLSGLAMGAHRGAVESANERARLAEETRDIVAARRVAEDRLRIARELHDVVAHHVSAINVQAGVAGMLVRSDPDAAAAALAAVRASSQEVLRELPAVLGVLRTDDDRVATAPTPRLADVDALLATTRAAGLDVITEVVGPTGDYSPSIELTAYRIIQESLTNAAKHGTGRARLSIHHEPHRLSLTVVNSPRAGRSTGAPSGFGLVGMTERVSAVHGTVTTGLDDEGRWVVEAHLPTAPARTSTATSGAHDDD